MQSLSTKPLCVLVVLLLVISKTVRGVELIYNYNSLYVLNLCLKVSLTAGSVSTISLKKTILLWTVLGKNENA